MRISDWSSDVCSSDLLRVGMSIDFNPDVRCGYQCIGHAVEDGLRIDRQFRLVELEVDAVQHNRVANSTTGKIDALDGFRRLARRRSEEHTSELQSTMRNSYAVFC